MSNVQLLRLLHTVADELAQRSAVLEARQSAAEDVKDELIALSTSLRRGRFRLAEYRSGAENADRLAGELASELTELTRLRDVKLHRRQAIGELMKQSEDPSAKKALRRERAELGTMLEELERQLREQQRVQAGQRAKRSELSHQIEELEVTLGELERRNRPLQSVLMTFEEHGDVLELSWLERVIAERLDREKHSRPSPPLLHEFIESAVTLMNEFQFGDGLFRRDYQRADSSALVSEAQIWALGENHLEALKGLDAWDKSAPLVETYQGLRFAVGAAIRKNRVENFKPQLSEFLAMNGLLGAMSRALFAVGHSSQNECRIAYDEWLRLESQFARATPLDEARTVSGSSVELFRLWSAKH